MASNEWMAREFARVAERRAELPPHARPVVTLPRAATSRPPIRASDGSAQSGRGIFPSL